MCHLGSNLLIPKELPSISPMTALPLIWVRNLLTFEVWYSAGLFSIWNSLFWYCTGRCIEQQRPSSSLGRRRLKIFRAWPVLGLRFSFYLIHICNVDLQATLIDHSQSTANSMCLQSNGLKFHWCNNCVALS